MRPVGSGADHAGPAGVVVGGIVSIGYAIGRGL